MIVKLTHTLETVHIDVFGSTRCPIAVRTASHYVRNFGEMLPEIHFSTKLFPILSLDGIWSENGLRACLIAGPCESYSINAGYERLTASNECCDSDLCNGGPFPGRTRALSHACSLILFQDRLSHNSKKKKSQKM